MELEWNENKIVCVRTPISGNVRTLERLFDEDENKFFLHSRYGSKYKIAAKLIATILYICTHGSLANQEIKQTGRDRQTCCISFSCIYTQCSSGEVASLHTSTICKYHTCSIIHPP